MSYCTDHNITSILYNISPQKHFLIQKPNFNIKIVKWVTIYFFDSDLVWRMQLMIFDG